MTEVLRPYLGKFVVLYLDDILVYSQSLELHFSHLRELFVMLKRQKLFGNLEKCALNLACLSELRRHNRPLKE